MGAISSTSGCTRGEVSNTIFIFFTSKPLILGFNQHQCIILPLYLPTNTVIVTICHHAHLRTTPHVSSLTILMVPHLCVNLSSFYLSPKMVCFGRYCQKRGGRVRRVEYEIPSVYEFVRCVFVWVYEQQLEILISGVKAKSRYYNVLYKCFVMDASCI